MEIVAIRHAPTLWNEEKRLQGRSDVPLSPNGRAKALQWRISRGWDAYLLFCSPLLRARQTADLLFPEKNKRFDDRLVEMDFGSWEGKRLADLRMESPEARAREDKGLDFSAPGGETPREVQKRLLSFLVEVKSPAVLVTHKAVIRALYSLATGWKMMGKPPHKLADHCARIFSWESGRLTLVEANYPLIPSDQQQEGGD